jgi:hypothetical protein
VAYASKVIICALFKTPASVPCIMKGFHYVVCNYMLLEIPNKQVLRLAAADVKY